MESMAFYMSSAQGGVIHSLFEALKDIVHDISITVDEAGMRVLTTDGVKQMLLSLKLDGSKFEKFHSNGTHRLGVNVAALFKLLRIAGARDTVTLFQRKADTETLGIEISNPDKKTVTKFSMKLLDVNFADIKVPDVAFDASVSMPSQYFQRLCRDISNIGTELSIHMPPDEDALTLSCIGSFASQSTVLSPVVEGKHVVAIERFGEGERCELGGTYSLKYTNLFNRASGLSPVVELFMKKNYPLVMRFEISNLGYISFALASSS
jgi:proliferating cell nuclear antigen